MSFDLGILTFAEITEDPLTGEAPSPRQRVRETLEQAQLADEVGLDLFAVGEHHRSDFVGSAPSILLAAAAERTQNIRLTSAVTVLSSEDPVRVWEQFATVDLLSGGRAEIIAGRGSYTESFPLFGYDLADYSDLFREKLDLLLAIREQNPLTWTGKFRAPPGRRGHRAPRRRRHASDLGGRGRFARLGHQHRAARIADGARAAARPTAAARGDGRAVS